MIFAVIGMFLVPNPAVASGIAFNYNGAYYVKLSCATNRVCILSTIVPAKPERPRSNRAYATGYIINHSAC